MTSDPGTSMAVKGSEELAGTNETGAAAQASQAQAMVLAQFSIAARNPRNQEDVRTALLRECRRPGFADRSQYRIPYKKWDPQLRQMVEAPVIGFSIRFAEAAARVMRNILVKEMVVYDDDDKRMSQIFVIDLESNTTYDVGVTVEKAVERKSLGKRKALGVRENSYGESVFLVRATEHEFRAKYQAEVSKAVRTCQLRLVPGDILEECARQIEETMTKADAEDPDRAKRRLIDGYAEFGVKATDLEAFLGHSLDGVTPGELTMLRHYYVAVRDSDITWREITDGPPTEDGAKDPHAALRKKATDALRKTKETSKKSKAKAAAKKSEPAAEHKAEVVDGDPRTPEEIAQGWEWDEASNGKIPPPGWGG